MLTPSAADHRRSTEPELLQALGARDPLALAETYSRTVPAAHAVARRLVASTGDVEALLLAVYADLWASPPPDGPLERWVRQRTWALGVEQLRRRGEPASAPSAAGLLPDLPAPDVRYLDAAERALAELPDDHRRALLQAHDQGIPSTQQAAGADYALRAALLSLAGPETSASDRTALEGDLCDDVGAFGDWCLGVADPAAAQAVDAAIASRPGCAALSRALRRGRRRIEGLPATPDMGHRILVSVLAGRSSTLGEAAVAPAPTPGTPGGPDVAVGAAGRPAGVGGLFDSDTDELAAMREQEEELRFGGGGAATAAAAPAGASADPSPELLQTRPVGARSALDDAAEDTPWQPAPETVSTGELRLSEILAADDDGAPAGPYASLRELTGERELAAAGVRSAYTEPDDLDDADDLPARGRGGASGFVLVLAWVVPILAGSLVGLVLAMLFVGS